jgi:hypothetical protein
MQMSPNYRRMGLSCGLLEGSVNIEKIMILSNTRRIESMDILRCSSELVLQGVNRIPRITAKNVLFMQSRYLSRLTLNGYRWVFDGYLYGSWDFEENP